MWSRPVGEWNYCCHFSFQFVIKQRVFVCVRHGTRTRCSLMCTALHTYVVWHINYNNVYTHAPMPCVKQTIQNYNNVWYHPLSTTPWQTPRPAPQHVVVVIVITQFTGLPYYMYNEIEPLQYNVNVISICSANTGCELYKVWLTLNEV